MSSIINLIGAIITFAFGVLAIIRPKYFAKLVALVPHKERGITEIRAIYGGVSCGLPLFALWSQTSIAFQAIASIWFGAALIRGIFMIVDKSVSKSHLRILFVELVCGTLLLI